MDYKFTEKNLLVVETNGGAQHRAIFGSFEYSKNSFVKASSALVVFSEACAKFHLVEQLVPIKNDPMYCVVGDDAQQEPVHANLGPVDASDVSDITNDDQVIRFLARRIWNLSSDKDAPDGIKGYVLEPFELIKRG